LASGLATLDKAWQIVGVDFSRIQFKELLRARDLGMPVEFESFSPYLIDYIESGGRLTQADLIAEDAVGLQVASVLRRFFPHARLISLYDEYNTQKYSAANDTPIEPPREFTEQERYNFKQSIVELLRDVVAIPERAQEGTDFLFIPESGQTECVNLMIEQFERDGLIERRGEEIHFVNKRAENPLYQSIQLYTKGGRWLCEGLDAAAFLKPENQAISHLVVLPSYMKSQQDKVWEIVKMLNIPARNYHNIFYDPSQQPARVCQTIAAVLENAENLYSKPGATC
jgi:hypothetical protein